MFRSTLCAIFGFSLMGNGTAAFGQTPDEEKAYAIFKNLGASIETVGKQPGKPVRLVSTGGKKLNNDVLKEIKNFKELDTLLMNNNRGGVTEEVFAEFKGLDKLQLIDINEVKVTAKGLKYLSELKGLVNLRLIKANIDDDALKSIKEFKDHEKLKSFSFAYSSITDAGLKEFEALKGMKTLTGLNVQHAKVTQGGVDALRKVIPKITVVGAK